MAHDPEKVDPEHVELFYHGVPGPTGLPVPLSDDEWDEQRAVLEAHDAYPWSPEDEAADRSERT